MADKNGLKFRSVPKVKTEADIIADAQRQFGARLTREALSDEQLAVYEKIWNWYESCQISTLTFGGWAGVGKTRLISVLAGEVDASETAFVSFTGKASSVLRRKFFQANVPTHNVKTLHSLMYHPVTDKKTGEILGWSKRATIDYDFVVTDESSMLTDTMFNDLSAYEVPILAVGDHGQLPPVMGSFNLMENPELRLETIHRQAAGNPIIALSQAIRETGYLPRVQNTPEVQVLPRKYLPQILESLYGSPDANYDNMALLCFTNRTRNWLNNQIRRIRYGSKYTPEPVPTDQVICLKNTSSTDGAIFNGMRGEVQFCSEQTLAHYDMRVLFADEELEVSGPVLKGQFGRDTTHNNFDDIERETGFRPKKWADVGLLMDFGYSLTAWKAQGSQWEHVIVLADDMPRSLGADLRRRALYTAVTRAEKYLVVLI